jgi:hypothetical protein
LNIINIGNEGRLVISDDKNEFERGFSVLFDILSFNIIDDVPTIDKLLFTTDESTDNDGP